MTLSVMKKYKIILGLIISTLITLGMLPSRLSQGQGDDLQNLIGSELVIWAMRFTSWCTTYFIQIKNICALLNIDFLTEIRAGMAVARLTFNEQ